MPRPSRSKAPPEPPSPPPEPSPPSPVVEGEVVVPARRGRLTRDLDGRKVVTRFVGVVARVPRYVKLGWLLMNDPTVSGTGKAALGGGLAYAISPIDPVPGFIPVLGQLDDLAVLLLAVRLALKSCPTEVADRHLLEAGLSFQTVERDLVTIRATAIWVTTRGTALALRAGKAMLSMAAGRLRDRLTGGKTNGDRA
ncbi:MAG TPA: YkvA family protein [Chloroflexota bacterium]|nr:YkvA family protein [Chloroflexota bacterium]